MLFYPDYVPVVYVSYIFIDHVSPEGFVLDFRLKSVLCNKTDPKYQYQKCKPLGNASEWIYKVNQ